MVVTVFVSKYPCDLKLLTASDAYNEIISSLPSPQLGQTLICMYGFSLSAAAGQKRQILMAYVNYNPTTSFHLGVY